MFIGTHLYKYCKLIILLRDLGMPELEIRHSKSSMIYLKYPKMRRIQGNFLMLAMPIWPSRILFKTICQVMYA